MNSWTFRNINEGLPVMVGQMKERGVGVETRNGPALYLEHPQMITYEYPTERWVFSKERDANPYLHFFDALHILEGRNDVEYLSQYSRQIAAYSDDGVTFNGAYGHRIRKWFGSDQFTKAIYRLKTFENDRRTVVGIWDPRNDLAMDNVCKDHPCNTHMYIDNAGGKLNLTVTQRSGDMMWGTMGANVVQFSYIQQYLAEQVGIPVGRMTQMCNNLHVYTDFGPWKKMVASDLPVSDYYHYAKCPWPILTKEWYDAVAGPMNYSYGVYKEHGVDEAIQIAKTIDDEALMFNVIQWLHRRAK